VRLFFFIVDISGYTRFIFSNQKEISHSQIIIQEIITSLLDEVKPPLQVIRLESDLDFIFTLVYAWQNCSRIRLNGLKDYLNRRSNLLKDKVFQELHRILKPGGRLQIADNLVQSPIPNETKQKTDLWVA
jgi:SAM-dependent methyltransferase